MRPTFLQFKSPKERTPGFYDTHITSNGDSLDLKKKNSPTFARSKRFMCYNERAKRTGFFVGPGAYSQEKMIKIKGPYLYKPLYTDRDPKDLMMIGDCLVPMKIETKNLNSQRSRSQTRPSSTQEKFSPSLSALFQKPSFPNISKS